MSMKTVVTGQLLRTVNLALVLDARYDFVRSKSEPSKTERGHRGGVTLFADIRWRDQAGPYRDLPLRRLLQRRLHY